VGASSVGPRRGSIAARLGSTIRILAVAAAVLSFVPAGRGDQGLAACDPSAVAAPRGIVAAASARVAAVTAIGVTVADVARSTAFFRDVLGFEKIGDVEVGGPDFARLWGVAGARARVVRLRLGAEEIELTEFLAPRGLPYPAGSRSNDRWFQHIAIVVSDMDAAYARVRPHVEAISAGPQTLPRSNRAAAGIAAFYFRDPDGHALELIHFPPGKGDPRWQESGGRLFLGIDHTAIAVGSTAASLAFYRDVLGLRVAGESHNVGIEQARLTGVAGADVRITGLRPAAGAPGVELLEYVAPRDGRQLAPPPRANDVVHWHTTVAVDDVASAGAALHAAGYSTTRDGAAPLPAGGVRATGALVVYDPDGHAVQLVAR
jgi:catechol 2,3-dioxygenase-like lactoylglutathione lyase family enzyme